MKESFFENSREFLTASYQRIQDEFGAYSTGLMKNPSNNRLGKKLPSSTFIQPPPGERPEAADAPTTKTMRDVSVGPSLQSAIATSTRQETRGSMLVVVSTACH